MKKERKVYIVIIIILLLLLLASLTAVIVLNSQITPGRTAVIEHNTEEKLTDNSQGQVRIKISPVVTVKNDTMQNLNFCNYNEDRLLKCKLRLDNHYIYESGFVEEGDILRGDFVETEHLEPGENQVLAEVYYYTPDEQPVGQTNVKIVLNLV